MSTTLNKQYNSSVNMPADDQPFWETTLSQAEEVPLEPRLTKIQLRSSSELEVFDVRYKSYGGLDIAGWYVKPIGNQNLCQASFKYQDMQGNPLYLHLLLQKATRYYL